ncbi:MAG: ABC transporter ATP-binding protein [Anaerolineales bacterium]|nr:ABC transporter ATP-binding protein [Anaerolineales bacterium]
MAPILQVTDLVVRLRTQDATVHAVNGVSFDLLEGETLAIVGESGCGKSMTVMSLLGLVPSPPARIESGQALFSDGVSQRDLLRLRPEELRQVRGGQIGFVFQDPMTSLNPLLTVGEQIAETIVTHLGLTPDQAHKQAVELLAHVGLSDPARRAQQYPHQFSGGMRQRVMIAIAIACRPRVLIADEPTTALDVTVQAQITDLVARLRAELGMAVIWITHDLGVVAGIADRVMVMYGGQIVERAPVEAVYERPRHPYTIGLLGALPHISAAGNGSQRLANIKGSPPDLQVPPRHCPFAPRCAHVFEHCWQANPALELVAAGHHAACFVDVVTGAPRPSAPRSVAP